MCNDLTSHKGVLLSSSVNLLVFKNFCKQSLNYINIPAVTELIHGRDIQFRTEQTSTEALHMGPSGRPGGLSEFRPGKIIFLHDTSQYRVGGRPAQSPSSGGLRVGQEPERI